MNFVRLLALAAVLGAVGLSAWGAYCYHLESRPVRSVEVEEPERDVGARPVGKSRIVFRVTNPTDHSAEVVSAPDACGKLCCLKPVTTARLPIPPGGSVDVECELLVAAPARFEFGGDLYLNDNGLRGVGVVSRADDAPPK